MPRKNPAAVALGRMGGKATAKNRSLDERIDAARKAVLARWAEHKKRTKEFDAKMDEINARQRQSEAILKDIEVSQRKNSAKLENLKKRIRPAKQRK